QQRTTASLHYSVPMPGGSWSSSLIWGRTHNTANGHNLNSYLAESVVPIRPQNFVTGRLELIDKDELFTNEPETEEHLERRFGRTFRIGAYTLGYTRHFDIELRSRQCGIRENVIAYSF